MKVLKLIIIVILISILAYCSNNAKSIPTPTVIVDTTYNYTTEELLTLDYINNYRVSLGIVSLEKNGYVSQKCEEHNLQMIAQDSLSHNGFVQREIAIENALGAKVVEENVGYGFTSPKGILNAWIASPDHKNNLVGDFS